MYGFNDNDDDSLSSAYTLLFLLTGLAVATYAIARFAESKNRFNYDSRFARIVAGCFIVITNMLHTKNGDVVLTDTKNKLITLGPHRTSVDAFGFAALVARKQVADTPSSQSSIEVSTVDSQIDSEHVEDTPPSQSSVEASTVDSQIDSKHIEGALPSQSSVEASTEASKSDLEHVEGILPSPSSVKALVVDSQIDSKHVKLVEPPQFFATTAYNFIPGVPSLMKMFKVIPVEANAIKGNNGRSANAGALEQASKVLSENGCVALFPQGNFARIGQEPPRVYSGAAKLALENKVPIHVIRLDGFWCLQNPLIPLFIRNNAYYRAFFSAFHLNNIRATVCCEIDFHLKDENKLLSDEEKIEEICAQLYAYYRHTQELTEKQIGDIKTEVKNGLHLTIWKKKVELDETEKKLLNLKKERTELEQPTLTSMRLSSM